MSTHTARQISTFPADILGKFRDIFMDGRLINTEHALSLQHVNIFGLNYKKFKLGTSWNIIILFTQISATEISKISEDFPGEFTKRRVFSTRQHAEHAICYRKSVHPSCLSVRHTGGSVENG